MGQSISYVSLRRNLKRIRGEIGSAQLMAVTKYAGIDEVMMLKSLGQEIFGESRVQDAEPKVRSVEAEWHMIGHVQSGRARAAARLFSWIDSVDSVRIAQRLSRHAAECGKLLDALVQVNIGREKQKHGVMPEDAEALASEISRLEGLRLRGLMAIPPHAGPERCRPYFREMKRLFERLRKAFPECRIDVLSLGMSGDYRAAVEEGSTMVRIGRALFS